MASHPYISGAGNISQMIAHLRNSFPATVNSETVKKLGLAPNNESFVINALKYIGIIDEEGKKTDQAKAVFSNHKDDDFADAFRGLVREAYDDLFDLHGDAAWTLSKDDLITFFRRTDETSAAIGARQAAVFQTFAALSGYGELPAAKKKASKSENAQTKTKSAAQRQPKQKATQPTQQHNQQRDGEQSGNLALTVRVEINLPADGSKEMYDNIFKSIKENLMNGKAPTKI